MIRQRKLAKNLGKDTHTRSVEKNLFQTQSRKTFEILTGEVLINQPEPAFSQNAVTISLSKGGKITGVPLPGAFIDPLTGNLHGSYDGPIYGQMISVGFVDGNSSAPIILNKYPYQGKGDSLTKPRYTTPMFTAGYVATDVLMGHFSGSVIGLYTGGGLNGALPGSIGIDATTECNIKAKTMILISALVSSEVKAPLSKLTGFTRVEITAPTVSITSAAMITQTSPLILVGDGTGIVEVNGNTKSFVTHAELDIALQLFQVSLMAHVHTCTAPGSPSSVPTSPILIDITAAKTIKTLTGG